MMLSVFILTQCMSQSILSFSLLILSKTRVLSVCRYLHFINTSVKSLPAKNMTVLQLQLAHFCILC